MELWPDSKRSVHVLQAGHTNASTGTIDALNAALVRLSTSATPSEALDDSRLLACLASPVSDLQELTYRDTSTFGPTTVWYFAFGANMSEKKFTHTRGITPLASIPAYIPGYECAPSMRLWDCTCCMLHFALVCTAGCTGGGTLHVAASGIPSAGLAASSKIP
jgi:hypothetical protein